MGQANKPPDRRWRSFKRNRPAVGSLILLGAITAGCVATLPWSLSRYDAQNLETSRQSPTASPPIGTDLLGRPLWARCALGGAISLVVGLAAAAISVLVGVTWGTLAGLAGGRTDALLMRFVDILYGLPYILLVILIKMAFENPLRSFLGGARAANIVILFVAIGAVSWLTMARVIRGQVLSLKAQPFVEAARAMGVGPVGILWRHLLPNLVGPIVVYATLTIPQAILQESFLSFLGIGVQPPVPSWGNLAADGVTAINNVESFWWLLVFPCGLLSVTLLGLNFLGDGLRDAFDPKTGN
ncbi:MAG: ABC transporter permease [Phycisphaerales bacterium]|nr:ABC transporter permease [Phycisphaerales bacterium]